MQKLLLIIAIGLVPILLWGAYFHLKNPRRQPLAEVLKIFILGMLSIVPVLLFHQWLLKGVMAKLLENFAFLNKPFIQASTEIVLSLIFVAAFMVIFALIQSFSVRLIYKLPFKKNLKAVFKKFYSVTPIILIFGLFLGMEGVSNLAFGYSFILSATGATMIFAVMEEYFKYIINPFLVYKKINSIGTAMIDALYVGLAFAFVENSLFFYFNYESDRFLEIIIYRSLITTLLHVSASGLLGYFYGLSLFSKSILSNYEIEKSSYKVPFLLRGRLKKDTVFKSSSFTQGFFLAGPLHAFFNLLLGMGQRNLATILVVILTIVIVFLLGSKATQMQYGLIGSEQLGREDYESLRLRISVLQHTKEIQKTRMSQEKKELKMKQKEEKDNIELHQKLIITHQNEEGVMPQVILENKMNPNQSGKAKKISNQNTLMISIRNDIDELLSVKNSYQPHSSEAPEQHVDKKEAINSVGVSEEAIAREPVFL